MILVILTGMAGCASADGLFSKKKRAEIQPVQELQRYTGYVFDAFDTTTTLLAYCASEEDFSALSGEISDELWHCHKLFDIYNSYDGMTNLRDVNLSAGKAPVEVPQEIIDILLFAKKMYAQTDGNMNVAFGSVLSIWHEYRTYNLDFPESAMLPDREYLESAAQHCNMDDLIIDESAKTVFFADPELKLDVGAIAKGYAVECAAKRVMAKGYDHVLINAGGNVRAVGAKPTGENWVIGVTNPDTSSDIPYIAKVSAAGKAVITSGVYQRFFMYEGKRYHPIIDKDTLAPEDRYLSVTILTDDSGYGDALSTAVFNMEFEEGREFVESTDGIEAMWVFSDGSEEFSSGFKNYWVD